LPFQISGSSKKALNLLSVTKSMQGLGCVKLITAPYKNLKFANKWIDKHQPSVNVSGNFLGGLAMDRTALF